MSESSGGRARATLALAWLAAFLPMLDTSIVNLSLPQLGTQFGATTSQLAWVVGAYLLPVAVAMLAVGRLGDAFGHRRTLAWGGLLFTAGAVAAGAAPDLLVLLVGRVLQGLGASALLTMSMAVVTSTFVGTDRSAALGVYLSGPAFGGAVGPVLGGVLTGLAGWRLIFVVQVPLALAVVVMTLVLVAPRTGRRPSLDVPGLTLATLVLAGVNVALLQANEWGWTSPRVGVAWGIAVLAAAIFVRHERRTAQPALRLAVFGNRGFLVSAVAGAAVWFSITSGFVLLPIYLERGRGAAPLQAALLIAAWPVAALAAYPFAGRLVRRAGSGRVLMGSLWAAAAASVALVVLADRTPMVVVPLIGVVLGVTTALLQVTSASGAVSGFAPADAGMASAVFNSIRQIGSSLGGAVPAAVFDLVMTRTPGPGAVLTATQASFAARSLVAVTAPLVVRALVRSTRLPSGPPAVAPSAVVEEGRPTR